MKKLIAIVTIAFSSVFAYTSANAQSMQLGVSCGSSLSNISTGLVNFSITSIERTNQLSNPIIGFIGGSGAEPLGSVFYWTAPTASIPLTLLVQSGGSFTVTNTGTTDQNVRIEEAYGVQSTQFGPYTLVPAGQTVTIPVPALGATYILPGQFFAPDPVYGYSFIHFLVTN